MQKERAERALQRGLPVPTPLPRRAGAASSPRQSATPSARGGSSALTQARSSRGLPLAVKLLGLGLGLLGVVYGLTVLRDRGSSAPPSAVPASMSGAV